MPEARFLQQHRYKVSVALLLTFASGLVDIVGYVGIFHFFTAHLTGTTVQLGHGLAERNWIDVAAAVSIMGAFVLGSVLGRAAIEIGSRRHIRRIGSITLAMEAALLSALAVTHFGIASKPYVNLAMLAAAMGMQTATLTGIGPL
jgi:uncharacterized membrane protein YoaK (UPF0700 family)